MCRAVYILNDDRPDWLRGLPVRSLRELALAGALLVPEVLDDDLPLLDCCFCCSDPEDVLWVNGWEYEEDEFGDLIVTKVTEGDELAMYPCGDSNPIHQIESLRT